MPIPINRNPDSSYGPLGGLYRLLGGNAGLRAGLNEASRQAWSDIGYPKPLQIFRRQPSAPATSARSGGFIGPTQQTYEVPGVGFFEQRTGRFLGRGSGGQAESNVSSPAAERAYRQEVSSVAQQAAQNPELKRYEDARLKAVAPGATPEQVQSAEDIGMQIWKKKYGGTPLARRGGSIGIDNPLMASTFGYQSGSAPDQQMGAPTIGPTPLVPQIDQSLNPASPNFIGGEGAPLMDFSRDNVTPEMIQAYQKQLLQQATSRK